MDLFISPRGHQDCADFPAFFLIEKSGALMEKFIFKISRQAALTSRRS